MAYDLYGYRVSRTLGAMRWEAFLATVYSRLGWFAFLIFGGLLGGCAKVVTHSPVPLSETVSPTPTASPSVSPTPAPIEIPKPTLVPMPSESPSPTPSPTPTAMPTPTPTPRPTPTPTPTPIAPPTANAVRFQTRSNTVYSGQLSGRDPQGRALTYRLGNSPRRGAVRLSGSTFTYTPATNEYGLDSFTYSTHNGQLASALATVDVTINEPSEGLVTSQRVGVLYELWHGWSWQGVARGARISTMTDVLLRGLGFASLPDNEIHLVSTATPVGADGRPELYCFFDNTPYLNRGYRNYLTNKNCDPAIRAAAVRRQAIQMKEAGIDFVVLDNTNAWQTTSDLGNPANHLFVGPELAFFRPIEVIFEEFRLLREAYVRGEPGAVAPPKLAVWAAVPSGSNYYQRMLRSLYDRPEYEALILKHQGKKVMFYVDAEAPDERTPSGPVLAEIAQHNIVPVPVWTHFGPNGFTENNDYRWDFLSPCLQRRGDGKLYGTSSVTSTAACDQWVTRRSPIGSVMTVGASYQVPGAYASQMFGSPGRLNGLTLRKQFDKVLTERPDYLFLSSWNEHGGGAFQVANLGPAVGHGDINDTAASKTTHFVDSYASEFTRDLEPTVAEHYGSSALALFGNLVDLYKRGVSRCDPSTYGFCRKNFDYVPVWAMTHPATGRFAYGTTAADKQSVAAHGYREICAYHAFQSDFCVNPAETLAASGPFIAYNGNRAAEANIEPVYRCFNNHPSSQAFFFTRDRAECSASPYYSASPSTPLFYVSTTRTSEMMNALHRCRGAFHSIAVNSLCPAGTVDEGVLGYVH